MSDSQASEETKLEAAQAHYGTDTRMSSKESFIQTIDQWGGPQSLLIAIWSETVPILSPLLLISVFNVADGGMMLNCHKMDMFTLSRLACDSSGCVVFLFPGICRGLVLSLVTWRLVRQRLWYVCLKYNILLDLDNKGGFAKRVTFTQMSLFAMVLVHFGLLIAYGHNTPIHRLILNPMAILGGSQQLSAFLIKATLGYILPAIFAIIFSHDIDDVEKTFVPFIKLYEPDPVYFHNHIGGCIGVCEGVARTILERGDTQAKGDASLEDMLDYAIDGDVDTKIDEQEDIGKACETFHKAALTFEGIGKIGNLDDIENNSPFGCKAAADLPAVTVWGLMSRRWWPLQIILKDDRPVTETPQFRKVWGIHCSLVCGLICLDTAFRIIGLIRSFLGMGLGTGWCGLDTFIMLACLDFVLVVLAAYAVRVLAREIRQHLLQAV